MRIISWNINGIRAHYEALMQLAERYEPDVLCLQKVKSSIGIEPFPIDGYASSDITAHRSQYYGVGIYHRNIVFPQINIPDGLAREGHFQALSIQGGSPVIFNVYTPFSNPSDATFSEERKVWDEQLIAFAKQTSLYSPLILCGDFNIVNQAIDTWDGNYLQNRPCYHDWERVNFNRLLQKCNLVDVFRELHPEDKKFTYFNSIGNYRASNQGDRIDYFLASRALLSRITRCDIIDDTTACNSNPIILDIDLPTALP